jgi:hypothetical protein
LRPRVKCAPHNVPQITMFGETEGFVALAQMARAIMGPSGPRRWAPPQAGQKRRPRDRPQAGGGGWGQALERPGAGKLEANEGGRGGGVAGGRRGSLGKKFGARALGPERERGENAKWAGTRKARFFHIPAQSRCGWRFSLLVYRWEAV